MKKMNSPNKFASWFWFILFAILFGAQIIPRTFQESPVDDEPLEITNGYFYWNGDVVTHNHHPPLAKILQALPSRLLGVNDRLGVGDQDNQRRAIDFCFRLNSKKFEDMFLGGRWVTLLFGWGIGLLLFLHTRAEKLMMIAALALWAFEPTLLAYSGLALDDIPEAFFFFSAVLVFKNRGTRPDPGRGLLTGLMAAMAVCCKFSALCLIPIFLLLELWNWKKESWDKVFILKSAVDWLWGSLAFSIFICFLYLPGSLWEPSHLFPWIYFWNGLLNMIRYSNFHHPTFFLGVASRENHWLYFPLVYALKTTLVFVGLTLACALDGIVRRAFSPWLWIPPLVLFLSILPVQNLGVSYLLPLFPFVILMSAELLNRLWQWTPTLSLRAGIWLVSGLLLCHAVSVVACEPNLISYFNELVSQPKRLYYLGDSNVDVGQDIKRVAQTAEARGWKNIKLAQFGGAMDPSLYGMSWEFWTSKDLMGPQPGYVYLANASLFQLGPVFEPSLLPIAQSWMIHTHPTGQVGDTWFYFEIPGKVQTDSSTRLESVHYF